MKKIYFYTLILIISTQSLQAQTLEWSHIFDTHSFGFGAGIDPNSLVDVNGKIIITVVENDTIKVYQFHENGTIANSYNSNKWVKDGYTPLIKTGQSKQALVFESYTQSGSFWFLELDTVLTVTREFQFSFPSDISFPSVHHLIHYNNNLYINLTSFSTHYLFKINEDNSLSLIYSGAIEILYGIDYILSDNENILFSYKSGNNHLIRCVSLENGTLVWEQSINRNHGILLEYKMIKNGSILYTAGLERAWVDGIADDTLGISHIDTATGDILFQAVMELSYCSGCFLGFEDFVYNQTNNHIYITYVSGFPEAAISLVEINNLSEDIIHQVYFPFEHDLILPPIGNRSFIHIQPNGQIILLYKSYKDSIEKTNLYIASLDSDLESIITLEINFDFFGSVEHPTYILTYDDSKMLITGIIPNADPSVFWEQVEYFVTMINLDDTLSLNHPALNAKEIILYPNPANNSVNFIVPEDVFALTILDVSGKIIHQEKIMAQTFDLDISAYPNGFYFVKISGDQKNYIKKLIVK